MSKKDPRDVPRGLGGTVADRPRRDRIVGGSDVLQDKPHRREESSPREPEERTPPPERPT